MARGKLKMKLIENEKTRAATLQKRIQSLKKKAYEFSTLCDVKICMIIFEPKLMDSPEKVEVWPSDPVRVNSIIDKYKTKVASDAPKKTFSIFDFFNIRKRQVHDEVAQVRKANFKAKFPTWDDRIGNFSPEQIASFRTKLDLNLEIAKRKIMLMKGDGKVNLLQSQSRTMPNPSDHCIPAAFRPKNLNLSDNHIQAHVPLEILNHFDHIQAFHQKNSEFGVIREQPPLPAEPPNTKLPSLSPADEALVKLSLSLNPTDKSLMMSMMNNLDFRVQSGIAYGSCSSMPNDVIYNPPPPFSDHHDPRFGMQNNNVMFNPPSISVLHNPRSTAMHNNVMFKEPKADFQTCFYTPSTESEPATYNQQQLMMPHVFQQMPPSEFYHDINEYEMKNKAQRFHF